MLKHVLDVVELLDSPNTSGAVLAEHLKSFAGADGAEITVETVTGEQGHTDFVTVVVAGSAGKRSGGSAPTLGVIGRLGGVGARPELVGYVSDGDGAAAALAVAAKLLDMHAKGDVLPGDVIVSTHVCGWAPTQPHHPVPFMNSPVDMRTMNEHEVSDEMDVVLSIDTTKGNRVINHRGIALSPTVKQGWILKVSDDLIDVVETVTGEHARTYPITMQDITPYGNGVQHINSILQPAVATSAPVVGLAITAQTAVAGCATGASHEVDIALAARVAVETAKRLGAGSLRFHDADEFDRLVSLYGSMTQLQSAPETA
ncbi:DUF1177 domain-containing protein [Goodfellowiella coeruleoviolacea]|uniref:DUF1177 domain-containing protein n=1 Tax=Goodfellowiella coeruleoviolacea TaxID=334858 RepID=A0AAE3GCF5_9PSEU|nr:DUF1177 domain-containing protein [Goodfellowiella coeruleoviolacea]MCP2163618.1 Protein of unknown function (DUF1177) [Goodfellowiella coeruleoviolacea]